MLDDDILNEIKKEEEGNITKNEIIEVDENEEISNTQYDLPETELTEEEGKKKKKKKKEKRPNKLKEKWNSLSKKKKIIIIVCGIVILLLIVGLLLYFLVFKKSDEESGRSEDPLVIVEKDNYRYEDGWLVFLDENGDELGEYECSNKNEELCYVAYYSNEDDFDTNKYVYESGIAIDFRSDILLENYVFIYDNTTKEDGNISLYDISQEEVLEEYALVKEVDADTVIVKNLEDEYGMLSFSDSEIETIINFNYDYLGYILESTAIVGANNGNYVLIDFDGQTISSTIPGEIKNFDSNNISVVIDGDYHVYNYKGVKVSTEEYDYIRFVDSYVIAVDTKRLYVFDSDFYPMTMEGVRISSNSYNTKLIFDDDLVQSDKEEAFSAYVNGSTLRISWDEEYYDVNLNEGKFSKTQEYYSYFQGKLYFYSDAAKETLLGSYACSYANDVTSETTELQNCFIAKESNIWGEEEDPDLGYLPIYNERYVFIADTSRPSANNNIVLYDLKDNKTLATYKAVDARAYSNEKTISFVSTGGTLVLAQNTSDSYGLINIGSSSVTGRISFKDSDDNTNTEAYGLNGYVVMKRSDGTYHLYDPSSSDNEITKNISTEWEIVDYKGRYVLTYGESKYAVYNLDDSKVVASGKYIFFESSYCITVDSNNKVGVYSYDIGNVDLIEEDDIYIDGKDYASEINYSVSGSTLTLYYTYNGTTTTKTISLS